MLRRDFGASRIIERFGASRIIQLGEARVIFAVALCLSGLFVYLEIFERLIYRSINGKDGNSAN
jgi:hypothetical protein